MNSKKQTKKFQAYNDHSVPFSLKPLVIMLVSAMACGLSSAYALNISPTSLGDFDDGEHQFENDTLSDDLRFSGNYEEGKESFVIHTAGTLKFAPKDETKDRVLFVTNNSGFKDNKPITQLTVEGGIKIDSFVSKKTQSGISFGSDTYKTFAVIQAGSEFKSKYDNTSGKIYVKGDVSINQVSSVSSKGEPTAYNGPAVFVGQESVFDLTKDDETVGNLSISNSSFSLEVIDLGAAKYDSSSMGPTFVVNDIRITETDAQKALTVFGGDIKTGDIYITGGNFSSGLIDISGRGQKDNIRTKVDISDITIQGTTIGSGPALYVGTSGGGESETGTVEATIGDISISDVTAKLADQKGFIEFNQNQNTDILIGDIELTNVTLAKNVGSDGISGVRFSFNQSVTLGGEGRFVFKNIAINRVEESTSTTYWSDKMSLLWLDHAVDGIHEVSATNLTNDYSLHGTNPLDKGPYLSAIQLNFAGEQTIDAIRIDTVTTHKEGIAEGIYQSDDGNHLKSNSISVKNVSGENDAYGLQLFGKLSTTEQLTVQNISGNNTDGNVYGVSAKGDLFLGTASTIDTINGYNAYGLYAESSTTATGSLKVNNVTGGILSTGIYFEGKSNGVENVQVSTVKATAESSKATGIHLKEGTDLLFGLIPKPRENHLTASTLSVSDIESEGESYGILGEDSYTSIDADCVSISGIKAKNLGVGIAAYEANIGSLTVGGIEAENPVAVLAFAKSKNSNAISINESDSGTVKVHGNVLVDDRKQGTNLSIHLSDQDSFFQGAAGFTSKDDAQLEDRMTEDALLNIVVKNKAQWLVTDNSYVTGLTVSDDGIVNLTNSSSSLSRSDNWLKVESKTFEANNGRIVLGMNLATESADNVATDQLIIHNSANGSAVADVLLDVDGLDINKQHSINWLISQGDGSDMTFTSPNGQNTYAPNGGITWWSLRFVEEGEDINTMTSDELKALGNNGQGKGQWYLVQVDKPQEPSEPENPEPDEPDVPDIPEVPDTPDTPNVPVNPDDPVTPTPGGDSGSDDTPLPPEAEQIQNLGSSVAQAVGWLSEKNDLRRRLGEVRYGSQTGAWAKVFNRQDRAEGFRYNGFKQESTGIHIGYDTFVSQNERDAWLVGATFRYAHSKQEGLETAYGGDGKLNEYTAKVYATWMHESGLYMDVLAQVGYYDQEINGINNVGNGSFDADYHNWGYGASVEVGHMFTISNGADDRPWYNHWFIEPQLELSYFYVKGEDFKTSTGLKVEQGNADFLTGRAGLVVGKKVNYGTPNDLDKRWYQVGVIGGINHEFLGDQTIKFTGTEGKSTEVKGHGLGGTSFYYGVTTDWQASNNLRIYGEVTREEGQHYTKDYGVNIGLKYAF